MALSQGEGQTQSSRLLGKLGSRMETREVARVDKSSHIFYEEYEAFYEAYYSIVLGYLRKKVNSLADAEDITGKVFLYCYEKWETYDPSRASQSTWLFMIVRSRWTDFLRVNKAFVDIDELDEMLTNGEDQIENAVRLESIRQELSRSLNQLQESQRKAIIMRYFGEYSDEEIAKRLNTTAGNIRVIIHRGLSRLRLEAEFNELF